MNSQGGGIGETLKALAKKKAKSAIAHFILKNPIVLGILILFIIVILTVSAFAGDIGDMGSNTISNELSSEQNQDIVTNLEQYLDGKINIGIPDYVKYGDGYTDGGGVTTDVSIPADFHSTSDVVNYAIKFLGVPYVWGGSTPSGFDCSGFVWYCYSHFKISIPRTSQAQFKVGTPVNKSDLKPGDLVFFEGNPPGHVGMYIGDGKYIQAPKTGDVVKVSLLNARNDYTGARRIVNSPSSNGNSDSDTVDTNTDNTDMSVSDGIDYTDAYNIIRKFYLSPGNVFGYMKYMEMSLGVKPEDFFSGDTNNNSDDDTGNSSTAGTVAKGIADKTGIPQEIIKERIEKNARKIADELKPNFEITTKTTTDVVKTQEKVKILGIDTGKTVTKTKTNKGSVAVVTHISSIWGEIDLQYKDETSTYSDADGMHTVTKPVYQGYKLQGKLFARLKSIIKNDFPDEKDLDNAVYFIIESGFDFDKKEQNGDWINGKLSDLTLDSLLGDLGGTDSSGGLIPIFFQWDKKWASNTYAGSTMDKLGSAPTSLAMVVSGLEGNLGSYDKNNDHILEPDEAADYLLSAGVKKDTDVNNLFSKAATDFGLKMTHYSQSQYSSIINELKQGHPVIANVHGSESISYGKPGSTFTQGNHYIVLVDIDPNNKVTVHDPYDKGNQNDRTWDLSTIIAPESSDFYAFNNPNIKYLNGTATAYCGDAKEGGGIQFAWGLYTKNHDLNSHLLATDPSIKFGTVIILKVKDAGKQQYKLEDGKMASTSAAYVAVDTGNINYIHGTGNGANFDIYFGKGTNYNLNIANSFGKANIQFRITNQRISSQDADKR